jgi:hypothetical protein
MVDGSDLVRVTRYLSRTLAIFHRTLLDDDDDDDDRSGRSLVIEWLTVDDVDQCRPAAYDRATRTLRICYRLAAGYRRSPWIVLADGLYAMVTDPPPRTTTTTMRVPDVWPVVAAALGEKANFLASKIRWLHHVLSTRASCVARLDDATFTWLALSTNPDVTDPPGHTFLYLLPVLVLVAHGRTRDVDPTRMHAVSGVPPWCRLAPDDRDRDVTTTTVDDGDDDDDVTQDAFEYLVGELINKTMPLETVAMLHTDGHDEDQLALLDYA